MNLTSKPSVIVAFALLSLVSCKTGGDSAPSEPISPGNDPNFTIVANTDGILESFNRKVVVFGIDIYAVPGVEDVKLLHAANVMAQYLDNDEDGKVEDQLLLEKMIENKSFLVMWKEEEDLDIEPPRGREGQDLGNDETHTEFVTNGKVGEFDATLEEVLHLINFAGHAYAYPEAFGQNKGSMLANAMDLARGGQFIDIPTSYPPEAWYSYYDETCDYADCQTIEYLYWAITSILGAQENRLDEIGHEWKLNTKLKVEETDTAIFSLLSDPQYKMPTILPDGSYRH